MAESPTVPSPGSPASSVSVSVVVPCYNSSQSLPLLLTRIAAEFSRRFADFEVILVDDDSRDSTWSVIGTLAGQYAFVRGLRMMRNFGQHNAILCGIRMAVFPIVVTLDDDLQHPPEEAYRLVDKILEGYDVVYGTPAVQQHGLLRDIASVVTKKILQNAMGAANAANVSAFRAFRTGLRDAFADYRAPFVSIDVLLTWATTRFTSLSVKHEERTIGQSNYTFGRLINVALTLMTGFTVLPLRFASFVGFLFTIAGFGLFFYVIARYFIDGRGVPGFAFLASVVTLFSGLQLFALGIIGEYLARIYLRMLNRPPYIVAESTTPDGPR